MPSNTTAKLNLSYLLASQADKHVAVNEALSLLDTLVQASVKSRSLASQPSSPQEGDAYILPNVPTGLHWSTIAPSSIVSFNNNSWHSLSPKPGWQVFVESENQHVRWLGSRWAVFGSPSADYRLAEQLLINGGFSIWQRSTSSNLTAGQTKLVADRWRSYSGSGGQATVERLAIQDTGTTVPRWLNYSLRHNQTSSATTSPSLEQRMEDPKRFLGTSCTVSAYVRGRSGAVILTPKLAINEGSGGNPLAFVSNGDWTITANWQRFEAVFHLPQQLGSGTTGSGDPYCALIFLMPGGTIFDVEFAGVQMDEGNQVRPLKAQAQGDELRWCQRYFAKTFKNQTNVASNTNDVGGPFTTTTNTLAFSNLFAWQFPVPMRVTPAIETFNPYMAGGQGLAIAGSGNYPVEPYLVSESAVTIRNTTPLPSISSPINLHVTADAEL